ncbi:extracellular solute-binding protein, partial [Corynebacterium sanguinis]|uniref:ABC transporter substrate-binding protein n=1 Tax=Corynebacterium sanguinis TaxID=2594913 RepID=UPI0021A6A273
MSRTPLRSRLIGLGMALVATAGLTACAGGSMSAGSAGQEGDPSTITFWSNHPGSSRDTELAFIEEFEKQNPDLDVELVTAGSNYEEVAQRFNAALAGGDLPDVVVASDVTWFNFALNEATTPLEDLWQENNIDAESYVDTLRDDYEYNGKHYGVPYARSTNLMWGYPLFVDTELAGPPCPAE